MKKAVVLAIVVASLVVAVPALARISANRLSANGVAVQGFDGGVLSVQSVLLPDGRVIALH